MTTTKTEPDYYGLIGVAEDAAPEDIRRAYGERVQVAMNSDRALFEQIQAAWEVLKDPARRATYDQKRRQAAPPPTTSAGDRTRMETKRDATGAFPTTPTMGMPASGRTMSGPTMMGAEGQTAVMSNVTLGQGGGTADPLRTQAMSLPPCPICQMPGVPGEEFCMECGFLVGSTPGEAPDIETLPKLVEKGTGREFLLKGGENTVGREGADIMLPDKTVSRRHARVFVDPGGGVVFVEDLGSTNGTRLDGHPVPAGQRLSLSDGSAVQFGSIKLAASLPKGFEKALLALPAPPPATQEGEPLPALAAPGGADASVARLVGRDGQAHVLSAIRTTFGRKPGSTIILAGDSYVSGVHAEIVYEDERFRLTDLGSTNGTVMNGRRISAHAPQPLKDGDEVVFGRTAFTFRAPGGGSSGG